MKKHLLSIIASIVICALLLIGCGGGGGGGGGTPAPSEQTEFIYSTEANGNGTFRLTSQKSGAVIESSEDGTLATGSSIVLTERLAKSNESKLYGGNSSYIYTLQAKSDNKTVKKLDKPIILTIPNNFSKEFKTFFLGSRSETASDWQYTQILDDNDTNPTIVKTARLAVKDLNTFKIKTFRLSYSFAIFASKDNGEDKPTNSDSVKLMTFSVDPIKVYYDKSSKYITDIKVSSCITANKSSALFDGSEVTSQLVFFNSSSADVSGLKIDGSTAVQTSSTDKDSSNNQYSHTLYIKSYKKNNIAISGNNATYTFELKLTGISTKDFPDSFRVKTVLKDANGTEFASEGSVKLKKEKEPEKIDTETNTSTNTSTGTNTNTRTSTNTSTGTSTNTKTSTGTSTNTNTKTSTGTSTNPKTNTSTDTGSGTTTQTDTTTGSATSTDTSTNTGSSTSTQTQSSTNTQTATNTNTNTGSSTSTQTQTNTQTDTSSNTDTSTSTDTGTLTTTEISVSISPADSETTKVEVTTPIKITFNEKMDKTQNLLTLVTLICNSTTTNLITASNQLEWSTENKKDVLTVKNIKLNPEQSYTIKLNSGFKTESGLTSTNQISSNFVTRDAVTLSVTTPSAQNVAVTSKIEITPSSGSISNVANASINFGSNSKTGAFSIENGKAYFTLTSGTTWEPETTYSGTISGLLDGDGCETKPCNFSFTTRNKVVLNATNLTTQNAPLNTRIEITPTGGTISSIENASINFNSNSKTGTFSIQNGKAYFALTSGTTWNPNTTYTGTISGILDSDGCETKTCSFSFTTRAQTTLAFQSQNSYHARSSLAFTVNNGTITDLSTANISYSGGSINCSLNSNNGNIICNLGENAQWAFNSYLSITISNLKDSEGAPVANSTANFNIGAQPYLAFYETYINANDDLVFTPIGSTITSLSNATVTFTGATVSGNLELVDGKVVYKLADNSFYPFASIIGIHIRGLKDSNGVTVADVDQGFNTEAQPCIGGYTKSENLLDDIVFSGNYSDWNVSGATAVFDNANVSGSFSIENGKILYKLNTGYNYPHSTTVTGKIKGIKNADGLPVMDCDIEFTTRNQAEVNIDVFNQVAYGKNSRNEKIVFNAPLFDTKNISYENIDLTNARMIMYNNNICEHSRRKRSHMKGELHGRSN
ncbi:MAG: Ig-like domain-containing protein [Candidatus Riflebacteria bacterium]|nr:Ig-like domain-containing protein [Candidatus Riflebacteria bacterium]